MYEALRKKDEVWKGCLLLIVYDEHGGLFDHVRPEKCESPDDLTCQSPPFDFTLLGPRVPAVIVSPYVQPKTIVHNRHFDHTSIAATAMALFTQPGVWPSDVLGKRARSANTFDTILNLNAAPRMEPLDFGALTPPAHVPAMGLSSLQYEQLWQAADLEQRLPHDLRTGINPDKITNEHDAGEYVALVMTRLDQAGRDGRLGH